GSDPLSIKYGIDIARCAIGGFETDDDVRNVITQIGRFADAITHYPAADLTEDTRQLIKAIMAACGVLRYEPEDQPASEAPEADDQAATDAGEGDHACTHQANHR